MREDMHKYVEDRFQEAIRGSDDNALALVRGELKIRRADHHDSIARSEARVVELVRGILNHSENRCGEQGPRYDGVEDGNCGANTQSSHIHQGQTKAPT
ncbi:hypothetical protein L915_01479 [Phytophthora nicotianae]|uniref:Uncharacterized protein n=1 Tax=Phytophthora nicotianae TaxID=4792 RepID=W2HJZ8_PHYNI|nr:hypothetical protein L915_01479 [Phytophthora nicotianae]